jgi:hypothetical protein
MRTMPRALVVTGAAVLLALAVVAAFLVRDGGNDVPSAGPPPSSAPVVPAGALTGDVDGDGTTDVVTLTRGDLLKVRLGSGAVVAHLLQDRPRLEGLADVGGRGLAVVVSASGGDGSRDWTAWAVRGDALAALHTRGHAVLVDERGSSTAWVAGHRLYDGSLDPLQHGADRVVVVSRTWSLRDGKLAPAGAGVRCWDRTSTVPPHACASGQDWAYDVGPHGHLPALLPTVRPAWADRSSIAFDDGTWKVHNLDADVDPEAAPYSLTHTRRGVTHTAQVPVGWAPALFGSPVRLGHGRSAVLLSQEGGDSDTWRVYADLGGRVQPLPVRGPVRLGGGFVRTAAGQSVLYSWLTPHGRLFTRIGTGREGHYHVYAWRPVGGDATTPATLAAHDLGTVCLDETLGTYGICS